MKIHYDFFSFERLGRMHEKKTTFKKKISIVLMKTEYFNIGFVSL